MVNTRRVLIVDVAHIAHNFAHMPVKLSTVQTFAGSDVTINTNISTGIIKNIHRWSHRGEHPVAVCFDRPVPARRHYFQKLAAKLQEANFEGSKGDYKGNRPQTRGALINDLNMTEQLLRNGGVGCLAADGYEADDLIEAAVHQAKLSYPDHAIDIVTNDTDLVPLVDDQVSVFLRSQKMTWAEDKSLEKNKYIQITPETYEEFLGTRSDFKSIPVPYNTILLIKLLRGDPSDNIPGLKKHFRPATVKNMLADMDRKGVDVANVFRYGSAETLNTMIDVLADYVQEEHLPIIRAFWVGMNINQPFEGRPRVRLGNPMVAYDKSQLQEAVTPLRIHLP